MMSFKQFSMSLVAAAAAVAVAPAMAATAPTYTSAVTIDAATVNSNLQGYTIGTLGTASYTASTGLLTEAVSSVSSALVQLDPASGLKFTKTFSPTITLTNFSYDETTNELFGNLTVTSGILTVLSMADQSVLHATSVTNNVLTPGGVLDASKFELSQSFKDLLINKYNMDPTPYAYLSNLVQDFKITNTTPAPTIPEPSTYVLMGLGLVGMAFVSRRKQA